MDKDFHVDCFICEVKNKTKQLCADDKKIIINNKLLYFLGVWNAINR